MVRRAADDVEGGERHVILVVESSLTTIEEGVRAVVPNMHLTEALLETPVATTETRVLPDLGPIVWETDKTVGST
jgi:hypothetical protein